ncbi:MAG: hypothetical protein KVP17_000802 [Porospora cf. gigantea B]|uniref:uncharacterized protein n=1 Tax=Porospora cf. gigantea B TaxID=2853592 RepID=UPI003571F656|nr:MAG: hypothetical protein KVP17_000802 [Porospora cf. gigantea B]
MQGMQGLPQGMQIALDDNGQPFILLRDQQERKRLSGLDAHKANIQAARQVADPLRTSFGPKGMDKIIVGPDGELTITNDGATILEKMDVGHPCAKLLVDLSQSQDNEIGDGTTGVVIFAGALLREAQQLLDKGLHPLKVIDGYDVACKAALDALPALAVEIDIEANSNEALLKAAETSLGSKVVHSQKSELARMCVDAVLAVADLDRRDVDFELIKVESKAGGRLDESELVHGIVLDKDFAHNQMKKEVIDAKIAILTCAFEPPKPKTKHKVNLRSAEDYKALQQAESDYFADMVQRIKASGANVVMCQWGFDDEMTHLLFHHGICAVRWVGGVEIELLALATGARIVPRFEELTSEKLGHAGRVREVTSGTEGDTVVIIDGCPETKAVSLVLRGGTRAVCAEAKRSVHDALCAVRNLVTDRRIVPGGGASEIACSNAVERTATETRTVEHYAVRAYANALASLPEALADNSGLDAIAVVAELKTHHLEGRNTAYGVDCMHDGIGDMKAAGVYESYISKTNQLALATQVVKMILKIDDVIEDNTSV